MWHMFIHGLGYFMLASLVFTLCLLILAGFMGKDKGGDD